MYHSQAQVLLKGLKIRIAVQQAAVVFNAVGGDQAVDRFVLRNAQGAQRTAILMLNLAYISPFFLIYFPLLNCFFQLCIRMCFKIFSNMPIIFKLWRNRFFL